MVATVESLTLEEFLARPETKSASEFIDGRVSQKPIDDDLLSIYIHNYPTLG